MCRSQRTLPQTRLHRVAKSCSIEQLACVIMNPKEVDRGPGAHPKTVHRRYREGKLPAPAKRLGHLLLVEVPTSEGRPCSRVARVPSTGQSADLGRQVAGVMTWTDAQEL
jgi:predicted site-specific integrase-resolvase